MQEQLPRVAEAANYKTKNLARKQTPIVGQIQLSEYEPFLHYWRKFRLVICPDFGDHSGSSLENRFSQNAGFRTILLKGWAQEA